MYKYLLFNVILFTVSVNLSAASFDRDMAKAQGFIDKGKPKQAISKLKGLSTSINITEEQKKEALVFLALAYRLNKQTADATATLKSISGKKPASYYLELAETQLVAGKYKNAVQTSKNYDAKKNKGTLLFVQALWISARSNFKLKEYLKCIADCKEIIKSNPFAGLSSTKADKTTRDKLTKLKKDAKELMKKAQELYDRLNYGDDYAWYRKARTAQFEGDYEEALRCYGMIRKGTLKNAARCYSGHCLDKLGKYKEAVKTYLDFANEKPYGLYSGEALWHAAMLIYRELSEKKDTERALAIINKLKRWLVDVRDSDRILEQLEGINQKLKTDIIDSLDPNYLAKNASGNLIKTRQYPESIINRLTAPWYFKELTVKTYLLSGFLEGEKGMKAKAAVDYKTADKLGTKVIITDEGAYPSLLAGLIRGFYLLPSRCGSKLSSGNYNRISTVYFLFCADQPELSEQLTDLYLKSGLIKRRNDYAAFMLIKAYCLIKSKKLADAEKILKRLSLSREFVRLNTKPRSDYLLGCIYAKSNLKKAIPIFKELSARKDFEMAPNALLAMAIAYVNAGKKSSAEPICDELRKKYSGTPFADAALTLRKALKKSDGKNIAEIVETPKGKLINYRRTIVIPGATSWDIPTKDLKSGDIVLYNIKCIGNGPCKIVKGVSINLTCHEPQPPKAKGDRIIFLRAPVLYVNNLTYGFKDKIPELKDEPEIPLVLE